METARNNLFALAKSGKEDNEDLAIRLSKNFDEETQTLIECEVNQAIEKRFIEDRKARYQTFPYDFAKFIEHFNKDNIRNQEILNEIVYFRNEKE